MSAQLDPVAHEPPTTPCPVCATAVPAAMPRCPACGYDLAGVDDRPGPYGRMWGVWAGLVLAVAYALALLAVLLGR